MKNVTGGTTYLKTLLCSPETLSILKQPGYPNPFSFVIGIFVNADMIFEIIPLGFSQGLPR